MIVNLTNTLEPTIVNEFSNFKGRIKIIIFSWKTWNEPAYEKGFCPSFGDIRNNHKETEGIKKAFFGGTKGGILFRENSS